MIGIVDYGIGNLGSISNALSSIGVKSFISNDRKLLQKSEGLILPGDGAAGEGMKNLKKLKLDKFLVSQIKSGKPILGICLGMQLLMEKSEEGNVSCLGVIRGSVNKIKTKQKLPQIGWNNVIVKNKDSKIMNNVEKNSYTYFIHSYICNPLDKAIVIVETIYGETFCSAFEKENIFGLQFHPEKSGVAGKQMLKNFINLC